RIMKNHLKTSMAVAIVLLVALPLSASAHCGSCGVEADDAHKGHAHEAEAHEADAKTVEAMSIFGTAEAAGFTTLVAAVKAAGLEETLTEQGPFTVFAPTDEAFAKLPEGTVENLLANPEQLKKVLLYHVVAGAVSSEQVVKLKEAKTAEGSKVKIQVKDGVWLNDAKVVKADIEAKNGLIHVIDTVLIPADL
ncbi:MAG: putative surface protein with fasciclin (FAS1) repeats, partial [Candidatus Krumholzibacteriia bacterium]